MKLLGSILLCITAGFVFAYYNTDFNAGSEGKAPVIELTGDQSRPDYVQQAMSKFQNHCSTLFQYHDSFDSINATLIESFDYQRQRGWLEDQIVVEVKISNNGNVPVSYSANGQTCTYMIDSGLTEITTIKEPCAKLCGMEYASTESVYAKLN